jgi:hypothetical protein
MKNNNNNVQEAKKKLPWHAHRLDLILHDPA